MSATVGNSTTIGGGIELVESISGNVTKTYPKLENGYYIFQGSLYTNNGLLIGSPSSSITLDGVTISNNGATIRTSNGDVYYYSPTEYIHWAFNETLSTYVPPDFTNWSTGAKTSVGTVTGKVYKVTF